MHATKDTTQNISSLIKRADFLRLNKAGDKWVSKTIVLQASKHEAESQHAAGTIRIGFTVTKRTFKSAVKRNRIKRRLRAVAMDVISEHALPNADYVLIGRPDTLTKPYEALVNDLKWCLKRMGFMAAPKQE